MPVCNHKQLTSTGAHQSFKKVQIQQSIKALGIEHIAHDTAIANAGNVVHAAALATTVRGNGRLTFGAVAATTLVIGAHTRFILSVNLRRLCFRSG